MQTITETRTYDYDTELVVELIGEDEQGEIAVVSYQFDIEAESRVEPRGDIEAAHRDRVEAVLSENGYELR